MSDNKEITDKIQKIMVIDHSYTLHSKVILGTEKVKHHCGPYAFSTFDFDLNKIIHDNVDDTGTIIDQLYGLVSRFEK